MWFGPIFQAEMMSLARRRWFFVVRLIYVLAILVVVSSVYNSMAEPYAQRDAAIPIDALAGFGQAIFTALASLQSLVVLTMTPALVADAIADEKQRRTLHYLMASELSSSEIVLGKLAARLLRLGFIGAIGLPVLALTALFGGVDLFVVVIVY